MSGERGLSVQGLAALRVAATIVHSLPALRAEVWMPDDPDAPRVRVAVDDERLSPGLLTLSPCAFRTQVARARQQIDSGRTLGFLGFEGNPTISVDVPAGGHTFAGGIHRVAIADRWIYAFGVCGRRSACMRAGLPIVDAWNGPVPLQLGLRSDDELGTVVGYAETVPGEEGEGAVVELLRRLLAAFTAEEVCGALSASHH